MIEELIVGEHSAVKRFRLDVRGQIVLSEVVEVHRARVVDAVRVDDWRNLEPRKIVHTILLVLEHLMRELVLLLRAAETCVL